MPLKVVIPSSRRANRVLALKAIVTDAVCVPESQAELYREHNPDVDVVAHPDTVKGLPAKRQWISEKFGDVFMVDDDVDQFARLYLPTYASGSRMTADEARDAVECVYLMAADLGIYLFSLAAHGDPRQYYPQRPFRLTGFVNGAAFGLRAGSKLWFPTNVTAVADTAISGLNAHYHRMLLMDERFGPRQAKTFGNPGGLSAHRTHSTEISDTETLQEMFGSAIEVKHANWDGKKNYHTPSPRRLRVPF